MWFQLSSEFAFSFKQGFGLSGLLHEVRQRTVFSLSLEAQTAFIARTRERKILEYLSRFCIKIRPLKVMYTSQQTGASMRKSARASFLAKCDS